MTTPARTARSDQAQAAARDFYHRVSPVLDEQLTAARATGLPKEVLAGAIAMKLRESKRAKKLDLDGLVGMFAVAIARLASPDEETK